MAAVASIEIGVDCEALLCGCGDIWPLGEMYIWQGAGAARLGCANCCASDGEDIDLATPADIALMAPTSKRVRQTVT